MKVQSSKFNVRRSTFALLLALLAACLLPLAAQASATNEVITYGNTAQIGGGGSLQITIAGGAIQTNNLPLTFTGNNLAVQLEFLSSTATTGLTNSIKAVIDTTITGSNYVSAAYTVGPISSAAGAVGSCISNFTVNAIAGGRLRFMDASGAVGASNFVARIMFNSR